MGAKEDTLKTANLPAFPKTQSDQEALEVRNTGQGTQKSDLEKPHCLVVEEAKA
jgi:hypothetical protein